ncbi:MAG: ATP synthase F1 subunit epsilon [Tissierellia bacterium]|nr:ATP synthase F1 subunit epsilon [Tissierellia bacterium]
MVLLEIVTPDGKFYSEEVEMVILRGVEGDLAFMKNTAPLVTPLGIGVLKAKYPDGKFRLGTINEGYVSGLDNQVTVVTDAFEWSDEIDPDRAKEALERAERRLEKAEHEEEIDIARAKSALYRAVNRLDLHKIKKN